MQAIQNFAFAFSCITVICTRFFQRGGSIAYDRIWWFISWPWPDWYYAVMAWCSCPIALDFLMKFPGVQRTLQTGDDVIMFIHPGFPSAASPAPPMMQLPLFIPCSCQKARQKTRPNGRNDRCHSSPEHSSIYTGKLFKGAGMGAPQGLTPSVCKICEIHFRTIRLTSGSSKWDFQTVHPVCKPYNAVGPPPRRAGDGLRGRMPWTWVPWELQSGLGRSRSWRFWGRGCSCLFQRGGSWWFCLRPTFSQLCVFCISMEKSWQHSSMELYQL